MPHGRFRLVCLVVISLLAANGAVTVSRAQLHDEPAAIERLFGTPEIEDSWFTEAFLAQVPAAEVRKIVDRLEARYGELLTVERSDGGYTVGLEQARVPARITLDASGRIAGLWFGPPVPAGDFADHFAAIEALPGEISYLVMSDGEVREARAADEPMAVGSAAKLAILKAVADAVHAGRMAWDDVVELQPQWRSLPTGILQDWPDDTPLTVATLAHLMISQSDNTATDALIHLAGRDAVEAITPRNAPFLTTRDLFVLKADANAGLRERWLAADRRERRALLEQIEAEPLPAASDLEAGVTHRVEWFMSASELCALLEQTAGLPSFDINPGLADPGQWKDISFKGGSETGVLNLSTRLVATDGTTHCVVATWNHDKALTDENLLTPYRGIVQALSRG